MGWREDPRTATLPPFSSGACQEGRRAQCPQESPGPRLPPALLPLPSRADPVSRKNVKSAHSTRNRYSSQWTLTKCQASTPARTLTSDWRTVGSQHGVTVTESDSYSASLSQDTGEPRPPTPAPRPCPPAPGAQDTVTSTPRWPPAPRVALTKRQAPQRSARPGVAFSPPGLRRRGACVGELGGPGLGASFQE